MQNLKQYVNEILKSHSDGNNRVFSFKFDEQKFWLKRIEKNIEGGFLTKIFKLISKTLAEKIERRMTARFA